MAKKDKEKKEPIAGENVQEEVTEEVTETVEVNPWEEKYNAEHDQFLRLAAEFDNSASVPSRKRKPPTVWAKPTRWASSCRYTTTWSGH